MNSLDFLYIALGGGFVILVIFLCVLLLHLTLVLRDVIKMTSNFKDVSDKVKESVFDPLKTLSEMTAGIGFVHDLIEKIRRKYEQHECDEDCEGESDCRKNGKDGNDTGKFSVHKLRK